MLWGSKRTGPDLARVGGKYSDFWHVAHLINPRDVVPESNMPAYAFLARTELRTSDLGQHLAAQQALGVPYTDEMIANAARDAYGQAFPDSEAASGVTERYGEATSVSAFDGVATRLTEMDALVAYLQVLGRLTDAAFRDTAATEQAPDAED
jgi:cytochrome c oxidase cbb3-type subunit 2